MHPVLFEISDLAVTAYGFALALSFAVGIGLAMRRAPRAGVDPDAILEAGVVALFSALLGSRILFAIENPEAFAPPRGHWLDVLAPRPIGGAKGLSMSLGVGLAVAGVLAWLRVRRQPVLRAADVMAPSVALGEAITRIGCFMNGCCHGVACSLPWGVRFPEGSPAWNALGDVAVHPTQLLTSAVSLATFAFLLGLSRRSPPPGSVFFALLTLWSGARLCIDLLRSYPASTLVWPASELPIYTHQPIVAALLATGVCGLVWLRRNRPSREA